MNLKNMKIGQSKVAAASESPQDYVGNLRSAEAGIDEIKKAFSKARSLEELKNDKRVKGSLLLVLTMLSQVTRTGLGNEKLGKALYDLKKFV